MTKRLVSILTICSLIFSSAAFSEEECPDCPETPLRKYVGKASADSARAARSHRWQNWILAAVVVTVGIVTLVLVKRHHDRHNH